MIELPATPESALLGAIVPALNLLPQKMDTIQARTMLLAIAMQESGLSTRRQMMFGPAKGLWQQEVISVEDVLTRTPTSAAARVICEAMGVMPEAHSVHGVLEHNDILAAAFARLLLWTDPHPLPQADDESVCWRVYIRTWRPGKPRPEHWGENHSRAYECICAAPQEI